ncbi:MAG: dihydroorotase, partial [Pseudomonadota bacterium]
MNIHIKNGRLIDPKNKLDTKQDVFISNRRIAAVGTAPLGFVAEQVIDASGLIVIPGLTDVAARLREPGYEYRATLESEMSAAVAGGVTSVVCMANTR